MYNNKNKPVECPINNYIEKEFLDAYWPLHFSQSVLLIPPFCVTNGFITPIDKICYIKIFLGIFVHVVSRVCYCVFLYNIFIRKSADISLIYIAIVSSITYCIAIIIIYIANVVHSFNTLRVLLKLRHAFFIIDLQKQDMLKGFKIWNFVHIIGVFWFNVGINLYYVTQSQNMIYVIGKITYLVCDLQFVCLYRTVSFGASILASWNRKMIMYTNRKEIYRSRKQMEAMFKAYMHIIEALGLCKKVYQFSILYQLIAIFNKAIYNVALEISKSKVDSQDEVIFLRQFTSFIWIFKSIMLLVNLSVACEWFYQNTRMAEFICTRDKTVGVTTEFDEETRRTCKNVVRYNRAVFARLSVFDACDVGATLPLRLMFAVGTYTVVLLQFAL